MMGEPKPIASLTSGLLARKGQAKPAMRPQGFTGFGMAQMPHEDLGWNDMGHDAAHEAQHSAEIVPFAPETPAEPPAVKPPVVAQREELERELQPVEAPSATPRAVAMERAAPGSKAKAAFTLRLDPDRHLKLRLMCAVTHKSAQALVVTALDAFLDAQPAVADLAKTAKQDR